MAKWVSDKNAVPPMFHSLIAGGKEVALVRRSGARKTKSGWRYSYQSVSYFAEGTMGGSVGVKFATLKGAKEHAERKVGA